MSNIVGTKIRSLREEKGITQEYLAACLGLTQSNYGRMEKSDARITIPKLFKIAEVLEIKVSHLLGEPSNQVIHQHDNETASAAYSFETMGSDKEHITSLKEEIQFLRAILNSKIEVQKGSAHS